MAPRRGRLPAVRRAKHLHERIVSFENLWLAARRARRGKRWKPAVLAFEHDLEANLCELRDELASGRYRPGPYRTFEVLEPKRRRISAAPYRDRVVHHALIQVVGPILARGFTRDSFANRVGFGTHRALRRFTRFLRSHRHVLQLDVRRFFPSLDHAILKCLVRRKIACPGALRLIDTIIDGSNPQGAAPEWFPGDDLLAPLVRKRGLPIGNLTSQVLANVYLDPVDHLIKEELRAGAYVRYVDDLAVFHDDPGWLLAARERIRQAMEGLRLRLHPRKTQLRESRLGASFLGFRVLPDRIRVRAPSLRRARRRLRHLQREHAAGRLDASEVGRRIRSWAAHLEHGDTERLRERVLGGLVFVRRELPGVPSSVPGNLHAPG